MKELEASCSRYAERRSETILTRSERRQARSAKLQIGQAQMAYVMQQHAKNCSECLRDIDKGLRVIAHPAGLLSLDPRSTNLKHRGK
jgi:hypothetical protein